jgi:hypothetical protein
MNTETNTKQTQTSSSQRRGKIARLPRPIRDQLNSRLDDGQEAAQILPWLNDLPEVREVLTQRFNGAPISPQNLSAWRQGGFQEWLLHRELLDGASRLCENAGETREAIKSGSPNSVACTLADHMVTQLSLRMAAFMGSWDGSDLTAQATSLFKIGQFILKLQQSAYLAEREALELPDLRHKAEGTERFQKWANAFIALQDKEILDRAADRLYEAEVAKEAQAARAKKRAKAQRAKSAAAPGKSSQIKVDKGSAQRSAPVPTVPANPSQF